MAAEMRRSMDPSDPGYPGNDYLGCFVLFNGAAFDKGLVITVDSIEGLVVYAPLGPSGCPTDERLEARGRVQVFDIAHEPWIKAN